MQLLGAIVASEAAKTLGSSINRLRMSRIFFLLATAKKVKRSGTERAYDEGGDETRVTRCDRSRSVSRASRHDREARAGVDTMTNELERHRARFNVSILLARDKTPRRSSSVRDLSRFA